MHPHFADRKELEGSSSLYPAGAQILWCSPYLRPVRRQDRFALERGLRRCLKFSATLYGTIQPVASDQDIRISDVHQIIIPEEVPS
jgi:hypothetical protein